MSRFDLTDTNVFEEETPWFRSPAVLLLTGVIVVALFGFLIDRLVENHRDSQTEAFLAVYSQAATPDDKLKVAQAHLDLPDTAVELLTLGATFSQASQYPSAQTAFGLVADKFPKSPLADAGRLGEAEALEAQGKLDDALPLLQQIAGDGYRPAAYLAEARIREDKKDFSGARQALQDLIAKYPESSFVSQAKEKLAALPAS